jgi:type I restriction enzyme S subunit
MSNVPSWRRATLAEIADLTFGATPSRNVAHYWSKSSDGFGWASIADLRNNPVAQTAERITKAGVQGSGVRLVEAGTLLMSFKLTVGRVAVAGTDLYTNEAIVAIKAKPRIAHSRWLFHILPRVAASGVLDAAVKGNTLNKKKLENLKLLLPPSSEQQRIAGVLDVADDAILAAQRLAAKVEQAGQGLRYDLLTRGIDESGRVRDPASRPEDFIVSGTGVVPASWSLVHVADLASRTTGSTTIGPFGSSLLTSDYRPTGVPVIFVRDVRESGFRWISNVYVSAVKAASLAAHQVIAGDVLITKMGAPPGISAVYPNDMPHGIVTADVIRLRPDPATIRSEWLAEALNAASFKRQVAMITGGVTRPKITLRDFRTLRLAVPSRREQDLIVQAIAPMKREIQALQGKVAVLRQLKQGLIDDLLTGRIRV